MMSFVVVESIFLLSNYPPPLLLAEVDRLGWKLENIVETLATDGHRDIELLSSHKFSQLCLFVYRYGVREIYLVM